MSERPLEEPPSDKIMEVVSCTQAATTQAVDMNALSEQTKPMSLYHDMGDQVNDTNAKRKKGWKKRESRQQKREQLRKQAESDAEDRLILGHNEENEDRVTKSDAALTSDRAQSTKPAAKPDMTPALVHLTGPNYQKLDTDALIRQIFISIRYHIERGPIKALCGRTKDGFRIDYDPDSQDITGVNSRLRVLLSLATNYAAVEDLLAPLLATNHLAFEVTGTLCKTLKSRENASLNTQSYTSEWTHRQPVLKSLRRITKGKRDTVIQWLLKSHRKQCHPDSSLLQDPTKIMHLLNKDNATHLQTRSLFSTDTGLAVQLKMCFVGPKRTPEVYEDLIEQTMYRFKLANRKAIYDDHVLTHNAGSGETANGITQGGNEAPLAARTVAKTNAKVKSKGKGKGKATDEDANTQHHAREPDKTNTLEMADKTKSADCQILTALVGADYLDYKPDVLRDKILKSISGHRHSHPRMLVRGRTSSFYRINYEPSIRDTTSVASRMGKFITKNEVDYTALEQLLGPLLVANRTIFQFEPTKKLINTYNLDERHYRSSWIHNQRLLNRLKPITSSKQEVVVTGVVEALREQCEMADPQSFLLCAPSMVDAALPSMGKAKKTKNIGEWSLYDLKTGLAEKVRMCFATKGLSSEEYADSIEQVLYTYKRANPTTIYGQKSS